MKNSIRIIAGRWRGRKLNFPNAPDLRPTSDRLRETLFNWLSPFIQQTHCLDFFAGSGILAWEALSRGANHVTLIDSNKNVIRHLTEQTQLLNCKSQAFIIHDDSLNWLENFSQSENFTRFDLVFLDPPFKHNADHINQICESIDHKKILLKNGKIYLETKYPPEQLVFPNKWEVIRNKKIGEVYAYFFNLSLDK